MILQEHNDIVASWKIPGIDRNRVRAKRGGSYGTPFVAPSIGTVLRRYMDLAHFISLVDREALFFSSPKNLGDPYEGSWTDPMTRMYSPEGQIKTIDNHLHAVDPITGLSEQLNMSGHDDTPAQRIELREVQMATFANSVRPTFVNCWSRMPQESEAMWKIYSKGQGVAIETDVRSLIYSFTEILPGHLLVVKYLDYSKAKFPSFNVLSYLSYKRMSFAHEHEVRAIAVEERPRDRSPTAELGREYEIDPKTLIQKVVVDPLAEDWLVDTVRSLVKRYGIDVPVEKSQIYTKSAWRQRWGWDVPESYFRPRP